MKSPAGQETVWELTVLPNWPNSVSVFLSVDTEADIVVENIEAAAARHGIKLKRREKET